MPVSSSARAQSELARRFPAEFRDFENLMGKRLDDSALARRDRIFAAAADAWKRNLARLDGVPVRYLMVAEAAPWSKDGQPAYFYSTGGRGLPDTVAEAFRDRSQDWAETLTELAKRGFLLIDSLPLAANYSEDRLRYRKSYKMLVRQCWHSFVTPQVALVPRWADEVLVVLAYEKNGLEIIAASGGFLRLPGGRPVALRDDLIVTNDSHNPDVAEIRRVFRLP